MDKEKALKYYNSFSFKTGLTLLWDALKTRDRLKRLAKLNRYKDYMSMVDKPELLKLHKEINLTLLEAKKLESYDYGEGYFYQGFKKLHITGFRDTETRYKDMLLKKLLKNKTVLDIGCNSGFLSLLCAETAKHVTAIDYNPYIVHIGELAASCLEATNIVFKAETFENFNTDKKFDVILSFANHSTYDQQTKHTLTAYFDKCARLLNEDGLFLFESHAPEYEGNRLIEVIKIIEERFNVKERYILNNGTFLDNGRTYMICGACFEFCVISK